MKKNTQERIPEGETTKVSTTNDVELTVGDSILNLLAANDTPKMRFELLEQFIADTCRHWVILPQKSSHDITWSVISIWRIENEWESTSDRYTWPSSQIVPLYDNPSFTTSEEIAQYISKSYPSMLEDEKKVLEEWIHHYLENNVKKKSQHRLELIKQAEKLLKKEFEDQQNGTAAFEMMAEILEDMQACSQFKEQVFKELDTTYMFLAYQKSWVGWDDQDIRWFMEKYISDKQRTIYKSQKKSPRYIVFSNPEPELSTPKWDLNIIK